jgi:hypothetical protein
MPNGRQSLNELDTNGTARYLRQDSNDLLSLSVAIGFNIVATVLNDNEQDMSNSQGSQATKVLHRGGDDSKSIWRHKGLFPNGPFPNAYNYRRRQLLDGVVRGRELPDADYHLSARERNRTNSESHAVEGKQQVNSEL